MTTPGGLPFPESTDPSNQGANDIKALALALDARGAGNQIEAGAKTVPVWSSGATAGIATVVFDKPFKTKPNVAALCTAIYTGASAGSFVPAMGYLDGNTTQVRFFILAIPWQTAPGAIQPWGGDVTINYVAVGPAAA